MNCGHFRGKSFLIIVPAAVISWHLNENVEAFTRQGRCVPQWIFCVNDRIDQDASQVFFVDVGDDEQFRCIFTRGVGTVSVRQCNDIGTVGKIWIVVIGPIDIDMILQVDRSWKEGTVRGRSDWASTRAFTGLSSSHVALFVENDLNET